MAIYISNIASLQAQRYLANATNALNTSYQRLASGLRINSAKDDAAGLGISNRMTSEINGLGQAQRNISDGIAFAQTTEGALDEMNTMLQRIRTLTVQSLNGTNTSEDREALQAEVDALSEEITRIAEQTKFGGKSILIGTDSEMLQNGVMNIQVGAYAGDSIQIHLSKSMRLEDIHASIDDPQSTLDADGHIQIDTVENAEKTLQDIDKMIAAVNDQRSSLGAVQNRLESSLRLQSNVRANMSDARSRIRDTDYAEESANLIRNNILQQTSLSILTMSNQRPNLILQLIGGI